MDAREELAKLTLGKIVSGLLLLAGLLIAIIWRETLAAKWAQVAEGLSKPALMALLGLVLIAAILEALLIAYLLYLLYRNRRVTNSNPNTVSPPLTGYIGMLGVLWDEHDNPCCPICRLLMSSITGTVGGFICPKCFKRFVLKDDIGIVVNLMNAKRRLIERRYELNQKPTVPRGDR